MLVISEADVKKSLSVKDAIKINADAFKKLSSQECNVPERIAIPFKEHGGVTLFKPAQVKNAGLGLKIVSTRPNNGKQGLPGTPALIVLVDEVTGMPSAMMDGTYLTALRTAAGSGAATEVLALPDASELLCFGAGLQAEVHIEAIVCVRNIKRVRIWNRTRENGVKLSNLMKSRYQNIEFSVVDDIKSAVSTADIIVMATNSSQPIFEGSWLKPGCHINGVGSYTPTMQELDVETIKRSKIYLDCEGAVQAGDIKIPTDRGEIAKDHAKGTLGDLLLGKIPGRESKDDITFFKSVGTAVQDISTAAAVLQSAREQSLGAEVKL